MWKVSTIKIISISIFLSFLLFSFFFKKIWAIIFQLKLVWHFCRKNPWAGFIWLSSNPKWKVSDYIKIGINIIILSRELRDKIYNFSNVLVVKFISLQPDVIYLIYRVTHKGWDWKDERKLLKYDSLRDNLCILP